MTVLCCSGYDNDCRVVVVVIMTVSYCSGGDNECIML